MPMSPDHPKAPDLTTHLPGPYRAMVLTGRGAGSCPGAGCEDRAASSG